MFNPSENREEEPVLPCMDLPALEFRMNLNYFLFQSAENLIGPDRWPRVDAGLYVALKFPVTFQETHCFIQ